MRKKIFALLMMVTVLLNKLNAQNNVGDIAKTRVNSYAGENTTIIDGKFITIKDAGGFEFRAFAAGPEDSKVGILLIHDFFGITPATKEAVERFGALGYLTVAVDLYKGRSATTNDSAASLLQIERQRRNDTYTENGN